MDKSTILNKYNTEENKLFAAKILDKIKLAKEENTAPEELLIRKSRSVL